MIDISAATTKNILLKKPLDKVVLTKTATFYTDGTDGKLQYITVIDDLDQIGVWELQGDVIVSGFDGGTSVEKFKVVRNINC